MTDLRITPNLDLDPWTDLYGTSGSMGRITRIGLLPGGTQGGRPTVALLIEFEGGKRVVAETTWALMQTSLQVLAASPVAELDRLENP